MIPTLSIPDIRDFDRINAELIILLDAGHPLVVLAGAERQRLLAFGLRGGWNATVEIEGACGPEVAAELDAPGLTVVCRGNVADGAGARMRAGRLLILGDGGDSVGINQRGGLIVVRGSVGHRAGLRQSGGTLALCGSVGRLASERRTGGVFSASPSDMGPHSGLGAAGGEFIPLDRLDLAGLLGTGSLADETLRDTDAWLDPTRIRPR